MVTTRDLLRILLGSLAFAAAAGVFAVLFANNDVLLRAMSTGLTTAGAAALITPLALMIDRQRLRSAALVGVTVVIAAYLLTLALIWLGALRGFNWEEELAGTIGMLFFMGVPAALCVALAGRSHGRLAGWTGIVAAAVSYLGFLIAIWHPNAWRTVDDEIWATSWSVAAHGLLLLCALVVPPRPRHWRWINVIAAPVSFALSCMILWRSELVEPNWIAVPLSVSCVVAFANVLLLPHLTPAPGWIRRATIAAAIALAADLDFIAVRDQADDLTVRIAAALSILAGCGTLATIVLVAVAALRRDRAPVNIEVVVNATCPRCGRQCSLTQGPSRCPHCDLHFRLTVEAPCCRSCGYVLYGVGAERCPECGTDVVCA